MGCPSCSECRNSQEGEVLSDLGAGGVGGFWEGGYFRRKIVCSRSRYRVGIDCGGR